MKLLCAQAQGMYWFLLMHRRFNPQRGVLDVVKGKRIGAAPWVDMGLQRLLIEAGYDLGRDDIKIAPVPGAAAGSSPTVNFGLHRRESAGRGHDRRLLGERHGRGSGGDARHRYGGARYKARRRAEPCFNYTMASVATTDALIARAPEQAAAVVRAIVKTQRALAADPALAAKAGTMLFPPPEAALTAELIRRDVPYYDASIRPRFRRRHESVRSRSRHPERRAGLRRRGCDAIRAVVEGIRKAYPHVIARSAKRDEAIQSGSTTGLLRFALQ